MKVLLLCIFFIFFIALTLSGCGSSNLLRNGSFEQGEAPWFALESWERFALSERHARDGRYAARVTLQAAPPDQGSQIAGLIQEISPQEFPKKLSGFYRVEHWVRGTPKQYLQGVVIVWGGQKKFPNIQIRYIFAGITEPPFLLRNGRFVFVGASEPRLGEWVFFERDLHRDFAELWGRIPTGFEKIRVLLEVRYDEKSPGQALAADVYYDALYLGD
ncbi:MAG: hypothetical protein NZO41_00930 [Candidatus Bipolaricaulota bacterium]|nr:hypothetical protein [Candidatus Bipolaricaulota bacterium]MDW8140911.1 hypothetical protein [Candidatus Bipolaricaulota bacterium]